MAQLGPWALLSPYALNARIFDCPRPSHFHRSFHPHYPDGKGFVSEISEQTSPQRGRPVNLSVTMCQFAPSNDLPVRESEICDFFISPEIERMKRQICDIGRRMWQRSYVDGNGGNLAIRVAPNLVLCTPTMVSKGFMEPSDLCLVDLNGRQLAGTGRRTSEILIHLGIFKRQPKAQATVHGHPPYGTAFGIAGLLPPEGLVSEYELFVSAVIAPYHTPGTSELGDQVASLAQGHNTILMANHGVVSWSHNHLEDAYFKLEIFEACCQTYLIAKQLNPELSLISAGQLQQLLELKRRFGVPDPRAVSGV